MIDLVIKDPTSTIKECQRSLLKVCELSAPINQVKLLFGDIDIVILHFLQFSLIMTFSYKPMIYVV